jgi:branched-chain amino acid transport system permease protein
MIFSGLTITNVNFALISAMLGLSIYLTLRTGLLSLANAGFMSIGAYTTALVTMKLGMPLGISVLCGGLTAGLTGLVLGLPVLRLKGIYLAIATIGFGEVVRIVMLNIDRVLGFELTGGALGLNSIPKIAGTWHILVFLGIIIYFIIMLERSPVGRALEAIREDERVAASMGIHLLWHKTFAFVAGAVIAGCAGGLSAHLTRFIGPNEFGFDLAVKILAFAVLGGSHYWAGPILGAFILELLPESLRFLKTNRSIVNSAVIMLAIIYLPNGLVGIPFFARLKKSIIQLYRRLIKKGDEHA